MMKHSPTPWKWVDRDADSCENLGGILDANGQEVCNFGNTETYYNTAGEEPCVPDIEFAIRAVNCHDKLLAACKAALGMAETGDYFVADLRNVLREAIAEAEGEPQ